MNDIILNIYKPPGLTSYDVIRKIKHITRIKKVGHSGTLDPMAEGVLLVCIGRATKKIPQLMNMEKEYIAEIMLGISTDTFDKTGNIVECRNVPELTSEQLSNILIKFKGRQPQLPPPFSARKYRGKRLYNYAREGKKVPLKPSMIEIYELRLMEYRNFKIKIFVRCSKGTYIRRLADDVGKVIGCGAHLINLIRTRIGNFPIEKAIKLNELRNRWKFTEG
ncbi:MAG: tRNA pseudouridine(55) synthase TruB [Fidelibacterota bacterium]